MNDSWILLALGILILWIVASGGTPNLSAAWNGLITGQAPAVPPAIPSSPGVPGPPSSGSWAPLPISYTPAVPATALAALNGAELA